VTEFFLTKPSIGNSDVGLKSSGHQYGTFQKFLNSFNCSATPVLLHTRSHVLVFSSSMHEQLSPFIPQSIFSSCLAFFRWRQISLYISIWFSISFQKWVQYHSTYSLSLSGKIMTNRVLINLIKCPINDTFDKWLLQIWKICIKCPKIRCFKLQ